MLDEKQVKIIERNIPLLLNEGEISKDKKNENLLSFYLENSLLSLNTAKILNKLSSDTLLKANFEFIDDDFESYLWVINSSYYSMFYMAGALLSKAGIKVKSEIGVHRKTFEALVYYFYLTKRIAKHYLEEFEAVQKESHEIMSTEEQLAAMQEKAKEIISRYGYEMGKRASFTYNTGKIAKSDKALTSLNRAIEFYNESLRIMDGL